MDRVVGILVRLLSACGACARVLPGIDYAQWRPGETLKILLAGYNGARNTGSDVRMAALVSQLRALFGDTVELSLMSLDVSSTSKYVPADVRQIPFSTLFFGKLYRACSEHHAVILCEGSTLKSQFANALTLYNCEAAGVMRAQGKPCIAYGAEVGAMEPFLARTARSLCSEVDFVVRSAGSLEALHDLGLEGRLGTDTAWRFDEARGFDQVKQHLLAHGWDGARPLLGIAPVNPFCWPVRPSLGKLARSAVTGDWSGRYQAWYYFSESAERSERFQAYLEALAAACATFAREWGFQPVIIGMEALDAEACNRLNGLMGGGIPVMCSTDFDGYAITALLRQLSVLATSRYHAQVLATGTLVPTVAISMDERLDNLAAELGTDTRQLLHVDNPDLAPRLLLALDFAWDNAVPIRRRLAHGWCKAMQSLDQMGAWLKQRLMPDSSGARHFG